MTLADKRALRIVNLQEEIEEAKKIIKEFVWPGDATEEQRRAYKQRAARFAGITVPQYDDNKAAEGGYYGNCVEADRDMWKRRYQRLRDAVEPVRQQLPGRSLEPLHLTISAEEAVELLVACKPEEAKAAGGGFKQLAVLLSEGVFCYNVCL